MYSTEYYKNLKLVMLHLANTHGRGFIFVSATNQGLIPSINEAIHREMHVKDRPLSMVSLNEGELPLITIQRVAQDNPNHALVVNFLDILVVKQGVEVLKALNFAREALNKLAVPILFWASDNTRQLIANQAVDLYSQRRFADIVFQDTPLSIEHPLLEKHFDTDFKDKEAYQNIKSRIVLLETQLQQALDDNISKVNLVESLIPQLIKAYSEINLYEEAKKIIDTYQKYFSDTAYQLETLSFYYQAIGDYATRLKLIEKILSIELSKGFENTDYGLKQLGMTYNHLATTYEGLGQYDKELEYSLKALEIHKKILSVEHPNLAMSYNNLATAYGSLAQYEKQLEYNLKALSIRQRILDPEHLDLATSYGNLATSYGNLRQYEEQLEYNLQALAIREKALPAAHPYLASSYGNLATSYGNLKKYDKQLEYDFKALIIREKVLPIEHPDLAISYNNLAWTYYSLGDLSKATTYIQKAMAIWEKVLPETHPYRVMVKNSLATFQNKASEQEKK